MGWERRTLSGSTGKLFPINRLRQLGDLCGAGSRIGIRDAFTNANDEFIHRGSGAGGHEGAALVAGRSCQNAATGSCHWTIDFDG